MKSRRTLAFWLALTLCAATVLGAMSWLTHSVLAAERERLTAQRDRATAEARADLEERTRLALWRMDALGAAIVLRENLVSADFYRTADPNRPAPAIGAEVQLRFQLTENQVLTTPPTVPAGPATSDRENRLQTLLAAHPPECFEWTLHQSKVNLQGWTTQVPQSPAPTQQLYNALQRQTVPADQLRKDSLYQQSNNFNELNQRTKAVQQTVTSNQAQAADNTDSTPPAAVKPASSTANDHPEPPAAPDASPVVTNSSVTWTNNRGVVHQAGMQRVSVPTADDIGQMRATWLGGELILIRKVTNRPLHSADKPNQLLTLMMATTVLQGVWLDSAVLTIKLLQEITDLLPQARLVPATAESAADPLALVSFPFKLERGETPLATAVTTTPSLGTPLWVAWGAVALAVLTSSLLVRGVLQLSERRASFVSAVTHELRTPLTTFRLYSDMLESGAVKEEKRGNYLRVLSREADRLSHLVENVLAFSRIERGNARSNVRAADVGELLESLRERFEARLATVGLKLVLPATPALRVRADLAAVEHILFNLIDNAAKYAARSTPPEVEIRANAAGRWVTIQVSDHGPGIPAAERHRVFQAFHKSAREAAESQPGVGLGLALSRRLAREQGGELTIAEAASGACFMLRLPSE